MSSSITSVFSKRYEDQVKMLRAIHGIKQPEFPLFDQAHAIEVPLNWSLENQSFVQTQKTQTFSTTFSFFNSSEFIHKNKLYKLSLPDSLDLNCQKVFINLIKGEKKAVYLLSYVKTHDLFFLLPNKIHQEIDIPFSLQMQIGEDKYVADKVFKIYKGLRQSPMDEQNQVAVDFRRNIGRAKRLRETTKTPENLNARVQVKPPERNVEGLDAPNHDLKSSDADKEVGASDSRRIIARAKRLYDTTETPENLDVRVPVKRPQRNVEESDAPIHDLKSSEEDQEVGAESEAINHLVSRFMQHPTSALRTSTSTLRTSNISFSTLPNVSSTHQ